MMTLYNPSLTGQDETYHHIYTYIQQITRVLLNDHPENISVKQNYRFGIYKEDSSNSKQPFFDDCCHLDDEPNFYIENGRFTKHPRKKRLFRVPGRNSETTLSGSTKVKENRV